MVDERTQRMAESRNLKRMPRTSQNAMAGNATARRYLKIALDVVGNRETTAARLSFDSEDLPPEPSPMRDMDLTSLCLFPLFLHLSTRTLLSLATDTPGSSD
jgi:hypothetical protein